MPALPSPRLTPLRRLTLGLCAALCGVAPPLGAWGQVPPPLLAPAQPGPALRAPVPPRPPHAPATAARNPAAADEARKHLREKIRAIRTRKLFDVVQPDAATMQKLTAIAETYEEQLEQARQAVAATGRELRKLLTAPKPSETTAAALSQQLITQRAKVLELEAARETAVRAVLQPLQFAKLVLAWPKINREIREEIYRVLLKKRARDEDI